MGENVNSRGHVNWFNRISCRSEYFKNSFVPDVINEWNKLKTLYDLFRKIRSKSSLDLLKERPSILMTL